MPPLSLTVNRVSVTVDLPDAAASRLRQFKHLVQRVRPGGGAPVAGQLIMMDPPPSLHVTSRDPGATLPFYRGLMDNPTQTGHHRARPADDELGEHPILESALAQQVSEIFWYHTMELPGGIVTPGVYDHRPLVPHYALPVDLTGQRVLDVAPFDGFWSFEFERRGGTVVAADIDRLTSCDFPPLVREALTKEGLDREVGLGFRLAHEAFGSKVERIQRSVYDLDPSDIGTFDFVHVADLLLHLQDPVAALRAVRKVTDGTALVVDCFDRRLSSGYTRYLGGWMGCGWWEPSLDTLGQMVLDAGFADVELSNVYSLPSADEPRGPWRASLLATT